MPIVNGQYVPDTLGPAKQAQQQVFGEYSHRDMGDYSMAAYNYLMKQQEQAYNLQLWKLQNEYNTPDAMMQRYQDAGLNPFLIYQQQNAAAAPAAASAPSFRSSGNYAKHIQEGINAVGQVINTVKAARETYDYLKSGRETGIWNLNYARERASGQSLQNRWDAYLLGLAPGDSPEATGPRSRMYGYQMDTQRMRYEQLRAVVASIPDQAARTRALKALDEYRLQILEGQYGFLSRIDTGFSGLDSFLQMLGFYLLGR